MVRVLQKATLVAPKKLPDANMGRSERVKTEASGSKLEVISRRIRVKTEPLIKIEKTDSEIKPQVGTKTEPQSNTDQTNPDIDTDKTGQTKAERPKRYRRLVERDIKRLQKKTSPITSRRSFYKIVKEIIQNLGSKAKIEKEAVDKLHIGSEAPLETGLEAVQVQTS